MNDIYNQIYKCRKCGAEFCPITVASREVACTDIENCIDRANLESIRPRNLAPNLYVKHYCDNGDIGVADFIGYERQEL